MKHFSIKFTMILLSICLTMSSCYSVKLVSTHGTPNPDPMNDEDGPYRNQQVTELNTVIKSGTTTDGMTLKVQREGCDSGQLFSVEYKNTFGGALLYLITFGSKRKVKIKYVCMKPEN